MSTLYPIGNDQGTIIINKLNNIAQALNAIKNNGVAGAETTLNVTEDTRELLNQLFGEGIVTPMNTRNYGDVLTVVDNSNHIDWESLPEQLPSHDNTNNSTDANKMLTVLNNGNLGWTQFSVGDTLPDYDDTNNSTDANKVLTILNNGSLDWENLPNQLPNYNFSDANKFLSVRDNGNLNWINLPVPEQELPSYGHADCGKFLTILPVEGNEEVLSWENINALPSYDTHLDEGKVLTVTMCPTPGLVWESILPAAGTSLDEDDDYYLLTQNSDGELAWAEPSELGLEIPPYYIGESGYTLMVVDNNHPHLEWVSIDAERLPSYNSISDKDKILMITTDGPQWRTQTIKGLPPYSQLFDNNKFLMVTRDSGPAWRYINTLPDHSQSDVDKILKVGDSGELEWVLPSTSLPTCNTANWILVNGLDGPEWKNPADLQSSIVTQTVS